METIQNNNNEEKKVSAKEKKKIDKAERRQAKIYKKKSIRMIKIALFFAAAAALILWSVEAAKKNEAERLGDHHAIQGDEHIAVGDHHDEYTTNPPTSGPHGNAIEWGVYKSELPDENLVHNLEHGGIWISYTGINEDVVAQLESLAKKHPGSVILTPRSSNDTAIAVASWGRLMKLDAFDGEKIETYIKQNINKSPEPLAR